MADYKNGKIYKITSPNCVEVYIGSTIQSLNDRFLKHKSDCKIDNRNINSKLVIDKGEAVIELIEIFSCDYKKELERREGEIMKATLNCCNYKIAGRTDKEYRIDNALVISNRKKKYRVDNRDKIKEKDKMYNIKNRDIINQKKRERRLQKKNDKIETLI